MKYMMRWLSNISELMLRIVLFDSFYSWVATCLHLYLAALLDCYIRGQEEWAELRKKYDRSALFHFADTEQTEQRRRETTENLWQTAFSLHWAGQLFHIYFDTPGFTDGCSDITGYCNIFIGECIFDIHCIVSSNWNNLYLLFIYLYCCYIPSFSRVGLSDTYFQIFTLNPIVQTFSYQFWSFEQYLKFASPAFLL